MPQEQDEIEEMAPESSTGAEDEVKEGAEQSAAAETPADPSTATDETESKTLSIVRDVVGEPKAEEAAASSAEGEEGTNEEPDTPKEPSDDYSDVPFNHHPRFRQLLRERNELLTDAGEYRKITAFMDANALTPEEAANGVSIMGLAKLDPVAAFKEVAPWFKKLAIAAGELLPDDLQKRVTDGQLTAEAAKEISRLRAGQEAQRVRDDFQKQRSERQQQTDAGKAIVDAAAAWERDRSLKDPNFAAKVPRIQREVAFLHATGHRPKTPEEVTKQLKDVYAAVNKEFKAPVTTEPKPQAAAGKPAIKPVRGGVVAGNARPAAPKGSRKTVDIIKSVLEQRAS